MTSPCRAEIENNFLNANIECPRLSWYWLIANDGQILNLFERGTFKMGVNFQLGIIWLSIYIINLSRYYFYIFFIYFFYNFFLEICESFEFLLQCVLKEQMLKFENRHTFQEWESVYENELSYSMMLCFQIFAVEFIDQQ